MKYFSAILFLGSIFYSSVGPAPKPKQEKNLRVFFMSTFNNDSVNLSTSVTNNINLKVSAQESLEDSSSILYLTMTPADTVVTIRDLENNYTRSARYTMNYDYLFIYYKAPKYTFRFSNKLLFVEE